MNFNMSVLAKIRVITRHNQKHGTPAVESALTIMFDGLFQIITHNFFTYSIMLAIK